MMKPAYGFQKITVLYTIIREKINCLSGHIVEF